METLNQERFKKARQQFGERCFATDPSRVAGVCRCIHRLGLPCTGWAQQRVRPHAIGRRGLKAHRESLPVFPVSDGMLCSHPRAPWTVHAQREILRRGQTSFRFHLVVASVTTISMSSFAVQKRYCTAALQSSIITHSSVTMRTKTPARLLFCCIGQRDADGGFGQRNGYSGQSFSGRQAP